jgi:hypothetical protein
VRIAGPAAHDDKKKSASTDLGGEVSAAALASQQASFVPNNVHAISMSYVACAASMIQL